MPDILQSPQQDIMNGTSFLVHALLYIYTHTRVGILILATPR